PAVVWGQVADRTGGRGIAGEQEGLAAAAAEILVPPRATAARLAHPVGAAEGAEGRGVAPDIGERVVAHRPELEPGDGFRRMARQHAAGRRDVERAPAPAADTGLGVAG